MLEGRCLVLNVTQLEDQAGRLRDLIFTRRKRRVLDGERKRHMEAELQASALGMGCCGHQANRDGCGSKTKNAFHISSSESGFVFEFRRSGDSHPVWLHHRIARNWVQ